MPAQEFYSAKLASLQFSALHIKEICDRPFISPAHPSSRLLLRGSYHCSVKLGAVLLLLVGFFFVQLPVVWSGWFQDHTPQRSLECVNLFFKNPVTSTVLICKHLCCISSLGI